MVFNSRIENSLALLTCRFVDLLRQSPTGVLDVKEATKILNVPQGQRRRVYDVILVLEGIGLIEKISKQRIRWKGSNPEDRSDEPQAELNVALDRKEIEMLDQHEKGLDLQFAMAQQSLNNTFCSNSQQAYVRFEDLCQVFRENTLVTIKAPDSTDMDIDEGQIQLKTATGRIGVMLVEKDEDNDILAATIPQETNQNELKQNDLVELDLLMKAMQEIDATNSSEKDSVNSFSLEYLGQEDMMPDTLQGTNNRNKSCSVIVENKSF